MALEKSANDKSEQVAARECLKNHLQSGKIVRGRCEVCGSTAVHGHHEDYAKPLDVHWLCAEHHRDLHRIRSIAGSYDAAVELIQAYHRRHPKPVKFPKVRKTNYNQELRKVVKARVIAKTVCITLPKELREVLGIGANDRVMVQLDKTERRLIVTKE